MIDIPVEVKDVLKNGTYKKNYRFIVKDIAITYAWDYMAYAYVDTPITIEEACTYKFTYSAPAPYNEYVIDLFVNGEKVASLEHTTEYDQEYIIELKFGDVVYIHCDQATDIGGDYFKGREIHHDMLIDNNSLVKESVSIDERMNSGDKIKFGLCEGSSLEFQYFGKPNINGKNIQAFIDVQYQGKDYYDYIQDVTTNLHSYITVAKDGIYRITIPSDHTQRERFWVYRLIDGMGDNTVNYYVEFDEDGVGTVEFPCNTTDTFLLRAGSSSTHDVASLEIKNIYTIPMGFFTVDSCSRQASTGIIKVTAYNKLMSDYLDAKANDEIVEIVRQGAGTTSSVDVGYILNGLLEGYSIEPKYTSFNDSNLWRASTETNYYTPQSEPNYDVLACLMVGIHVPVDSLSLTDYFQAYANLTKCHELVMDKVSNYGYLLDENFTRRSESEYHTLKYWLETYRSFQALVSARNLAPVEARTIIFSEDGSDGEATTNYFNNAQTLSLWVAMGWKYYTWSGTGDKYTDPFTLEEKTAAEEELMQLFHSLEYVEFRKRDASEIEQYTFTTEEAKALPDVTLRELQAAVYEINCQYGQLSRITDLFSGLELNQSRLYPQETLYPDNALHPMGAQLSGEKAMYSKLWADEGNVHKWRYLIITYKGLDSQGNETEKTLQRTVDEHGTDNYNMSDNWLFRNLVWAEEDVAAYADAMVAKMQNMTWFPFEMWCAGLPYLETGDEIEMSIGNETYTSYILQRTLKGIQDLQDTYINGTLDIF